MLQSRRAGTLGDGSVGKVRPGFPVALVSARRPQFLQGAGLRLDSGRVHREDRDGQEEEKCLGQSSAGSVAGFGLGTPVRLAVVEEVADAVDGVLHERGDEENDDARGGRDVRDRVERGDEARCFRDVGEN